MLFSGKIRFHDVARLTARCVLFATICHYSPLFVAIHHYSRLFVLFAIRNYSLFGFSRHPKVGILHNKEFKFVNFVNFGITSTQEWQKVIQFIIMFLELFKSEHVFFIFFFGRECSTMSSRFAKMLHSVDLKGNE